MTKYQIISIEGNIGSGKSTLLEILKEHYNQNNQNNKNIVFIDEPVEVWASIKDESGKTMLQLFYEDKEHSFAFQMMAAFSLYNAFKNAKKNNPEAKIFITERSLQTTRYVFANMLYDGGFIKDVNMQVYKLWFEGFADDYSLDKIIYVKTSPTVCYNRIIQRSRTGEDSIPLKYLENCDNYHETKLIPRFTQESILELDGNLNIHDQSITNNAIRQIDEFIKL